MLLYREIHRTLRYLQVKYRRVRKGSELPLSIAEVHLLVELDAARELTINQLSESLMIAQSQVSRVMQKLRERRLIIQYNDRADSRRVLSALTREGRSVVDHIDAVMGEIFSRSAQTLSKKEQNELSYLFEKIAAGYGCPIVRIRSRESKLRASHRQMARVFGLLGTNVYGSEMTRSQWSVLETIVQAPEAISAQILEGYLGIRSSLISEILTSFEAHGQIEKIRSRDNHRVYLISPTRSGRRLFRRLETNAVIKLKNSLIKIPKKRLNQLLGLLKRFAGEWGKESIFLSQAFVTQRLESPAELKQARAFSLRELVSRHWEDEAPDPLFPDGQQVWALIDKTTTSPALQAICVAEPHKSRWSVNFAVASDSISESQFKAFIQHAHYLSYRRNPAVPIFLNFEPLVA